MTWKNYQLWICQFFLLFCTKIHHMPNPSAVEFFFIEFAASNLFDDSPTDRFEIGIQERITIWKNYQLSSFFAQKFTTCPILLLQIFLWSLQLEIHLKLTTYLHKIDNLIGHSDCSSSITTQKNAVSDHQCSEKNEFSERLHAQDVELCLIIVV